LNLVEAHLRVAAFQNVADTLARLNRTEAGFLHPRGFGGHDFDMSVDLRHDIFNVHFHSLSLFVATRYALDGRTPPNPLKVKCTCPSASGKAGYSPSCFPNNRDARSSAASHRRKTC
jgi:hypothetical protein